MTATRVTIWAAAALATIGTSGCGGGSGSEGESLASTSLASTLLEPIPIEPAEGQPPPGFEWAPATVFRTGQTISYAPRDDGDLQKGMPLMDLRFVSHDDGTVTDRQTALVWTLDANPLVTPSRWEAALQRVAQLNAESGHLGHSDWRLPNANELESLVDYGQSDPALPSDHPFVSVVAGVPGDDPSRCYWTSTPAPGRLGNGGPAAMAHSFSSGAAVARAQATRLFVWLARTRTETKYDPKKGETVIIVHRVLLPRTGWAESVAPGDDGDQAVGTPWPEERFEVLEDGTVRDTLTGLTWTRSADPFGQQSWHDALSWIEHINATGEHGGHSDWRLPNARELRSLLDHSRAEAPQTAEGPFFGVRPESYWTSTSVDSRPRGAWSVSFGLESNPWQSAEKPRRLNVWPVRGEGFVPVEDSGDGGTLPTLPQEPVEDPGSGGTLPTLPEVP